MIALSRNKQKMKYSLPTGKQAIYSRDDDGNIIYVDIDGEQVPMETGEYKVSYGATVDFEANINGKVKSVIMQSFGADDSANYVQMVVSKGMLPFVIGTVVWRKSSVEMNDGVVDASSADYVVRGILDESLNEDMYLLRKLKVDTGEA